MAFNEKTCKIKAFDAYPTLKTCGVFLDNRYIVSTLKLFANDTSVFCTVNDASISADELNKDLQKISEWVYRWKMSFNLDLTSVFF